jgi:hypothetical protein
MERDIVKTAPDMVVYIDDYPFIENPYIGDSGTSVNFNDFITTITGHCDCDSLIPTASIVLSVPNHFNYLFLAPGGNKILATMSIIKIFSKGYYFDDDGNTVYHRVFYGLIDSVGYSYTGTTLQITIGCKGIMRLFELIQTNVAPGAANFAVLAGKSYLVPFRTKDYDKSALAIIYKSIFRDLNADEIAGALPDVTLQRSVSTNALDTRMTNSTLVSMVKNRYILRWAPVMSEIKAATRIFGWDYELEKRDKKTKELSNLPDAKEMAEASFIHQTDSVSKYLPDYAIGNITLLQSKIVTKLERISSMSGVIGYEAYQDLNGNIIFKPPLYNLDVTNTTAIDESKNPFIINLDEIIDESEQEDEQAIRATRVTVKGQPWGALLQESYNQSILPGVSSYTDMNLFAKFGMREEPIKEISWLKEDNRVNYAYAISEMFRMNRAYRTYRFSIPMRPEMKVGFPCYIKHHDMYGYTRNISWSYTVGGTATMSVTLDSLRRRVLVPIEVKNSDGTTVTEYKSIPNLVSKFSKKAKKPKENVSPTEAAVDERGKVLAYGTGKDSKKVPDSQAEIVIDDRNHNDYEDLIVVQTRVPDSGESWLIGEDEDNFFVHERKCDTTYLKALSDKQPFTDNNGYELYGPFPWGRWVTLESAIGIFTLSLTEQKNNNTESWIVSDAVSLSMILLGSFNPDIANLKGEIAKKTEEDIKKLSGYNVTKFTINASKYDSQDNKDGPKSLNPDGPSFIPKTENRDVYKEPLNTIKNTFIWPKL